jgi:hypothetical protein
MKEMGVKEGVLKSRRIGGAENAEGILDFGLRIADFGV